MRGHIDMGIARKCRTAMVAGDEQQTRSVSGGRPTGTRHLPAFGGTRRRLVSPRVLGHRSVVAPSEQIDSSHLVEIDTPTRN
jgi:hypothetical protein